MCLHRQTPGVPFLCVTLLWESVTLQLELFEGSAGPSVVGPILLLYAWFMSRVSGQHQYHARSATLLLLCLCEEPLLPLEPFPAACQQRASPPPFLGTQRLIVFSPPCRRFLGAAAAVVCDRVRLSWWLSRGSTRAPTAFELSWPRRRLRGRSCPGWWLEGSRRGAPWLFTFALEQRNH